jgi:hypothetical protein
MVENGLSEAKQGRRGRAELQSHASLQIGANIV